MQMQMPVHVKNIHQDKLFPSTSPNRKNYAIFLQQWIYILQNALAKYRSSEVFARWRHDMEMLKSILLAFLEIMSEISRNIATLLVLVCLIDRVQMTHVDVYASANWIFVVQVTGIIFTSLSLRKKL